MAGGCPPSSLQSASFSSQQVQRGPSPIEAENTPASALPQKVALPAATSNTPGSPWQGADLLRAPAQGTGSQWLESPAAAAAPATAKQSGQGPALGSWLFSLVCPRNQAPAGAKGCTSPDQLLGATSRAGQGRTGPSPSWRGLFFWTLQDVILQVAHFVHIVA